MQWDQFLWWHAPQKHMYAKIVWDGKLVSEAKVIDELAKLREASELGELDTLIEKQAQFGRRDTPKNI